MANKMRTGLWLLVALLLPTGWLTYMNLRGAGVHIPMDDAWIVESYRSGKESKLGALGITAVTSTWRLINPLGRRLDAHADFLQRNLDKGQGEFMRYLEDVPGFARTADLSGATVSVILKVPMGLAGMHVGETKTLAGAQVFLESENPDGMRARQYGSWTNLEGWGSLQVLLKPSATETPPEGHTDPGFDPEHVMWCGLKLSLNQNAQQSYNGTVSITEYKIELPVVKPPRPTRQAKSDDECFKGLPVPEPPALKALALPVNNQLTAQSASIQSIGERPMPADPRGKVWEIAVHLKEYQPQASARSARAIYTLKTPLDLTQKKITAWAAVGPALRGLMTRPNQIQFELYDMDGKVLRGPAADLSKSGLIFSPDGSEAASRWVKLEATPLTGIPLAMGYIEPGFRADKVQKIGIRFEAGKFSNLKLYPLSGKLLLSEFRVEDQPAQTVSVVAVPKKPPVKKTPLPIEEFVVGINYAFINYGWDIGNCPYGGRTAGGFSSYRHKLDRDFALFKSKGIRVVRVFLLGDLRTGLTYENGKVSGLDEYVTKDVEALISAAAKNDIKLLPVLLDFLVADGTAKRNYGFERWQWKEGEAPQLITDPEQRSYFLTKALRPIIQQLAQANDRHPNLIYAVDIVNEIENAVGVATPSDFHKVIAFILDVRDLIRNEAPRLPVTLGSRNREDLVNLWADTELDIWQYHHYDKMEEEESRPLNFPAGKLGLSRPIIVGEVEPSDIAQKLDTIHANGYAGALFWSYHGLDGFIVDLDAIKLWLEKKKNTSGK